MMQSEDLPILNIRTGNALFPATATTLRKTKGGMHFSGAIQ
jgi:hypothetical protein